MKTVKTLSIKCDCDKTIDFHELQSFQGGLKERTESDYEKAKTSILKYGWSFVLYYWNDGKKKWIIDGHNRVEVLSRLEAEGYLIPPIPAIEVFCKNRKEAKQKLLRLNSTYGRLSKESVLEFAEDIDLNFDEIALPDTVIDFSDQSEEEPQETQGDDDIPDVMEEPVSKRGEMYELGNSILMCGDSTNAEDVARLMGGEKADIAFTSPPYNVGNSTAAIPAGKKSKYDGENIDNKSVEDYRKFLNDYLTLTLEYCEYSFMNIQSLCNNKIALIECLYDNKDFFADTIIWDKINGQPAMGKNILNSVFEYVHIFSKKGNRAIGTKEFRGTLNNIIHISKQTKNEFAKEHNATFPVEFAEFFIQNFSEKLVYEPFGGTGTTLIACEKYNRSCRCMELSEKYCDVIRKRYTLYAKQNGLKITSGCLE